MKVHYTEGYKFTTTENITEQVGIFPPKSIAFKYATLSINGWLTIGERYAWNGMSGIPMNIKSSIRGVLFHDALYQMLRLGYLDIQWKPYVDQVLHDFCVEDGMIRPVAAIILAAVHKFGLSSTTPKAEPPILEAP